MAIDLLVNIDVDDLENAVAFYRDGLGLVPGRRLVGNIQEMLGGSSPIFLIEKSNGSAASSTLSQQRDYRRHWTPVHLDFVVEEIADAINRAQRAGAILEGTLQSFDWGKMANFADPFGHGFCLIEFIGQGYDDLIEKGNDGRKPHLQRQH
jgi:predicted enzyme related to lactoylglutathione lyase